MQIVVNTRLLLKDRLDGIGWFSYQTLKRITQNNPDVHFVFLFDRTFDEAFIFAPNITPLILSPQARHPVLYHIWFQYVVKPTLNRLQPDLFLSPDGFLSIGAKCPQLPIIHDINFLKYPKDSKWLTGKYYNYYFPKFAKIANRVGTVSEFSKHEIATNYGIDPNKIDVMYNGVNEAFRVLNDNEKKQVKEKYTQGKDYFVCVGSLHPRKNIVNLINAYIAFRKENRTETKLVFAGPNFWGTGAIQDAATSSEFKSDIIFTGRLSDEELALVLGSAKALTYIPYYEGFGIPLIEAMAAGVPVLTSNVTSLPEVAADAALLVNPFDTTEIKNAIIKMDQNIDLRESLILKGFKRHQDFSWDQSAERLWKSILKASRPEL